jgi:hypothetical protein
MLDEKYHERVRQACDSLDARGIRPPRVMFNEEEWLRNEVFDAATFRQLCEATRGHKHAGEAIGLFITEVARLQGIGADIFTLFMHDRGTVLVDKNGYLARYREGMNQIGFNVERYRMDNPTGGFDMSGLEDHPVNFLSHEGGHHLDWDKAGQRWFHSTSKLFADCVRADKEMNGQKSFFTRVETLTKRFYKDYHSDACLLEPFANMIEMFSGDPATSPRSAILESYRDNILRTDIQLRTQLSGVDLKLARKALEEKIEEGLPVSVRERRGDMARAADAHMRAIAADIRERFGIADMPVVVKAAAQATLSR